MIASSATSQQLFRSPILGPWSLTPEGAAIHENEFTAVIADVHLGYEWARGSGGDMIPAHSYQETQDKLERVFDRAMIKTLIIAGDLVETSAPCPRTRRDVRRLVSWLNERSVQLIWLRGNHDPATKPALPSSMIVDGWKIAHGDRPIGKSCAIFGHHHPSLRADGLRAPCFLAGPRTIVLPAFSPNAAGLDILSMRLPACLKREPLRCIAGMGEELLDFGCVEDLLRKVGR